MISDCRILGIPETENLALIKAAFRRRAKELHPDTAAEDGSLSNHYLFVELCAAYDRLLARFAGPSREKHEAAAPSPASRPGAVGPLGSPPRGTPPLGSSSALTCHADPAYVYYRSGVKILSRIHPSQWNIDTSRMLNIKIVDDDKEQELIKKKVMDLVSLFPKAYYYFGLVVHEYPDSIWRGDSEDKLRLIEERIWRYRNIIESFTVWNDMEKRKKEKYRAMLQENRARYADFRDDLRKEWEKG